MARGLGEKRRRFVMAYLGPARGNATKAAIMAGFSKKTAKAQGSRLLTFVDVQEELARRRKIAERASIMTMNDALEYLSETVWAEDKRDADRTRACELFIRTQGGFTDKHVIGASGDLLELLGGRVLPEHRGEGGGDGNS